MARRYQHTMRLLPEIKEMLAKGMTQKEVEQALGLACQFQILRPC